MENSFEHIEELISKVLANEANAHETELLQQWRKQSPQNEAHFQSSKKLLEAINAAAQPHEFDTDAAWNKLDDRISNTETKILPLRRHFALVRVAAAILLLVTLGFIVRLIFINDNSQKGTVMYASNKTEQKVLPDGSKVFMNKNSELSYVEKKGRREVKLKGEAYFEVVHNDMEPFVIEVNEVMIKDIGTAFNVKALPEGNTIEVLVESGEVQFFTENSKGLNLVAGQKAVYNKSTKTFSMVELPATDNTMSYRSKIFHFDNVALKDVLAEVNTVYGSNIKLADEKTGNCRLSVEFNNENLEVLISIIAETLELEVEQKAGTTVLKGAACPQ